MYTFPKQAGPHSDPSFTLRAAKAHLLSQELQWDITLHQIAENVHVSLAKFVVKFSVKNYIIVHNLLHVRTQCILYAINKNVQLYCCYLPIN